MEAIQNQALTPNEVSPVLVSFPKSVSNKPTSFSIANHFPITIPLVCRRVERSDAAA